MVFKFARARSRLPAAIVVAALAAIGACAGRVLPVAGPADLARGADRYPDLTADELAQGRTLFTNRCGNCHLPPQPTSQPPEAWPGHIAEMRVRARLDDRQARLVERYVVTMALASRKVATR